MLTICHAELNYCDIYCDMQIKNPGSLFWENALTLEVLVRTILRTKRRCTPCV